MKEKIAGWYASLLLQRRMKIANKIFHRDALALAEYHMPMILRMKTAQGNEVANKIYEDLIVSTRQQFDLPESWRPTAAGTRGSTDGFRTNGL